MLNDSYVEQVLKAKPRAEFYLKMILSVLFVILGFVISFFITVYGILVSILGIIMYTCFIGERKVEYEYIMTNGSVEIAAIYSASKRKTLFRFDAEQIEMVVPRDSDRLSSENISKKRKYVSVTDDLKPVSILVEVNNKKELVDLDLNEKTIAHLKTYVRLKMHDM